MYRGRFTLAMYEQMQFLDFVVNSTTHFISVTLEYLKILKENSDYMNKNRLSKFRNHLLNDLHKNDLVAEEWLSFIVRLFQ